MNDYAFGNFLYTLRTEKGLSQSELGKIIGVSNKAVSKWEMGISKPRSSMLLTLADFFGVTVEELLNGKHTDKQRDLSDNEDELNLAITVQIKAYRNTRLGLIISAAVFALSMTIYLLTLIFTSVYDIVDWLFPFFAVTMPLSAASFIATIVFLISTTRKKQVLRDCFPKHTAQLNLNASPDEIADQLNLEAPLNEAPNQKIRQKGMRKKYLRTALYVLVSFIVTLAMGTGICYGIVLWANNTSKDVKLYHDPEIYIQQKYRNKEEYGAQIYFTGSGANHFLPAYEEIEYNYSEIDFYIFDGTATLLNTAITFALDLRFNDQAEYEAAKQNELTTRSFRTAYEGKKWYEKPVFEFDIGEFTCKTVDGEGFPSYFGLICFSDNALVLRYLFFEEWEASGYVQKVDYIFKSTNCPWVK